MSEISKNQLSSDEVDKIIQEIGGDISTINQLIQEKLSSYHDSIKQILYIQDNIKKLNDLQHIDMLKSLKNNITEIKTQVAEINIDDIKYNKYKIMDDINILIATIGSTYNLFNSYLMIFKKTEKVIESYLKSAKNKAEEKVNEIDKLKNILKDRQTYEIYKKAETKYRIAYFLYLFLALIGVCYGLNWSMDLIKSKSKWITEYGIDIYDFWAIKITAIFIVITGVTFCLKQAIHYQKKKDKAEQTRLELEALPIYMFDFSDEQKNEVYKELTGKYFGRDFDNEGYKDMANLIQEQIRLSHEVLKDTLLKNSNSNTKKDNGT